MAEAEREPERSGGGKALRWAGFALLWLLGLLVLLFVIVAVVVATPLFEKIVQGTILPRVSETIERRVTVESAQGWLVPPRFRFEGLRVQGLGERPIFEAERTRVRVKFWETATSLGQVVALTSVGVEGVEANLVRLEDGTFDLPKIPEAPPEKKKKREIRVDDLYARGGVARFVDAASGMELEATELFLSAWMAEEEAALEVLEAAFASGWVEASARATFAGTATFWEADLDVDGVDLAALPPMQGKLDGTLGGQTHVSGGGTTKEDILRSLNGTGEMVLEDGRYLDTGFLEEIATELGELIYVPKGGHPDTEALDLNSPIRGAARIEDGWVRITEPPQIEAAFGGAEITGGVSLAKQLDLVVDVGLSTEFLSAFSGGLVSPDEPVPVTLRIEGTTDDPEISLTDTDELEAQNPGFFRKLLRRIGDLLPGGD